MSRYEKLPRQFEGRQHDGTLASAQAIQEWVRAQSGLLPVIRPLKNGQYGLYIMTLGGGYPANPGDTVLQEDGNSFYPLSPEALAANYKEVEQ